MALDFQLNLNATPRLGSRVSKDLLAQCTVYVVPCAIIEWSNWGCPAPDGTRYRLAAWILSELVMWALALTYVIWFDSIDNR